MNKDRFTKALLTNIQLPDKGKRVTLYDQSSRGLCVIATHTGVKSFYVLRKVRGKTERILLGRFPDTTIEQARKRAGEVNSKIDSGINPNDLKRSRRAEPSLGEFFDTYMEKHVKLNRRNPDNVQTHYQYIESLANKKISEISTNDIRKLHQKLAKTISKTTANKAHTLIRAVLNKAIEWGVISGLNPASGIQRFTEKSRERFLMPDELPAFLNSVNNDENEIIRDFILILLFTGARRREAQSMRWQDIDFNLEVWVIPDTKNGEPRMVALVPQALKILNTRKKSSKSEYVFPGNGKSGHLEEPKKAWHRILKRADIENLRLHDLRRTFGSWMTINGANMQIVGKALGHKDINSTAIYARLHIDPVREAAITAVTHLLKVAEDSNPANK